jgi:hypothetical protein
MENIALKTNSRNGVLRRIFGSKRNKRDRRFEKTA